MKKTRSILSLVCLAFLISLSFLQSNTKSSLDIDLESLLSISRAEAESGDNCSSWGYKNWNAGWWLGDGVDCICRDQEKVKNDCI